MSTNTFAVNSRYATLETTTLETADGRTIAYLRRRFVPAPSRFELLVEHTVTQDERLDAIAAQYLGDAEQFWRICDANGALRPSELEAAGLTIRITLPEGIPGNPYV